MKRRSVTFTDSPPEVIDNSNDYYNVCAPLLTDNTFLWLQLTKVEARRRCALETRRQWQQHHYSRSVPDLNKQHHYLSVELKSVKSHFNNNREKNMFHQKQKMDQVHLSVPDLGMPVRTRPSLRVAIESMRNVTKTDTSWYLHDLCRKGCGKKLIHRHYESLSDYFRGRRRGMIVTVDAAAESPVKNTIDIAAESSVKDDVGHGVDSSNDNDDCTDSNGDSVSSKAIIRRYRSSVNDGIDCNKYNICADASNLVVHHSYTGDNRNDSNNYVGGADNDIANVIKNSGTVNESNNDCGKLAKRLHYYHQLNDYKKSDSVAKIDGNWFWGNVGDGSGIRRRCYSLLNKPLQQKNCHRRHRSSDTRNMSFVFTSTASNNSSMRNIISNHQWYYYPSMMYSKTQKQLVDEMAKHIAECLEQFNTGLDKVLQARQLLETSQELPAGDRETMLRLLNQAMRTSLKRMEYNDDRHDPDGRHSESPNSLPGQRQCAPVQQFCDANNGNANLHNITSSMDPAEFFQQHGQQLLALLQQNMAKQN
ncbi:hypothetical protein LOAG_01775 [Loa loa]|uniref:SH2 domain-containing protein n=1 Tax=Loa loa TaxID=7209 RepID=A0A1I7VXM2_LOALO|nr:hypothetical protein LOAG_01775 [Loa loa]EFO26710.1 hypothetical protein LOAG_01775 [Loa loa]